MPAAYDPDKHHRRSIRLRDYDYGRVGAYFVTICIWNREYLLGQIQDGIMSATPYGDVVVGCWRDIPQRATNVVLDEFIVMPNHIHGIIILTGQDSRTPEMTAIQCDVGGMPSGSTVKSSPLTLRQVVAWFKYESAKRITALRDSSRAPVWQRNYYEHIIRENEWERIRDYIRQNPARWPEDENNCSLK